MQEIVIHLFVFHQRIMSVVTKLLHSDIFTIHIQIGRKEKKCKNKLAIEMIKKLRNFHRGLVFPTTNLLIFMASTFIVNYSIQKSYYSREKDPSKHLKQFF